MNVFGILGPLYFTMYYMVGAAVTAGLFVFHIAVVPLLFKNTKAFKRNLIFANIVQWPLCVDYKRPSKCGLEGTRNLSINFYSKANNCQVEIGAWHILPKSSKQKVLELSPDADQEEIHKLFDEELAKSNQPVILYCHGNSGNRAASHRLQLYNTLQDLDFHTITIDYRGYGNSTNIQPTERGVVEDALAALDWIHKITDQYNTKPAIFIWGHSLGTGISSHLIGNLGKLSKEFLGRDESLPLPNGLILESPFNNLADAVANHPLSKLVQWLPYYHSAFIEPFKGSKEHEFLSDEHLKKVPKLPILILHAEDDHIIPFRVGKMAALRLPEPKYGLRVPSGMVLSQPRPFRRFNFQDYTKQVLYNTLKQSRQCRGAELKFHSYEKKLNYGHKWICKAEDLPQIVGDFISTHK